MLPPPSPPLLAPEQQRSAVVWLNPPPVAECQTMLSARLRVENRAGLPWDSRGRYPILLQSRWRTCTGEWFDQPPQHFSLPRRLYPGEPDELTVDIPTPDVVGDFTLMIDFIQDGQSFATRQPDCVAVATTVAIVGNRQTDIDYHAVYRTANLQQNHWWVVGAYHSREQYEQSSRERLAMLQQHGLRVDSHVLDIGCGTGQMAAALETFLSDQGSYSGCDIGKEAIAYCRRTFRRPNFRFAQSEMTRLPFTAGGSHDLAIFFSVFTHTYIDETSVLLAETKRLLRDDGRVIADVIVSPLVERGAGHRGEMILNREYFERIVTLLGFQPSVIGRWPWHRHAERLMYQLSV